ncbi:MAG: 5'-nucleotidase C-terminal domain-containing protein [Thermoanaerobaculia bacterium]|nr:5'-nucleotidase C-terminal domain-containing protein [Thermoanaerobaculia bacterium]
MRAIAFTLLFILAEAATASTTVTLLHFSDYHSHALPFYSEGKEQQGGIARTIGYLKRQKKQGALVFSGGDMMNKGAPAWSDKYGCAEWPWLNGVIDAMAFGNHDADYGFEAFTRCKSAVRYPILSANAHGFPPYAVLVARGKRIGVFALAGPDFPALVNGPELRFRDRIEAARSVVRMLRGKEHVDAVVMIGHEHAAADDELVRAVAGIDVIFGTHSHLKQELKRIEGTTTWFISPFQYMTYISRVEMTFGNDGLQSVTGSLVPVDSAMPVDRMVEKRVAKMRRDLERDPAYTDLFRPFATLAKPMSVSDLGNFTVGIMREAAGADAALSTASSFRGELPEGPLDLETLRAAMPYDNEIVVADLTAENYTRLLAYARGRDGDSAAYISESPAKKGATVRVATTDYLARVAPGYRDFFAGTNLSASGVRIRANVKSALTLRR